MSKIKVVLWDIDGTLLNFKAAEKAAIRKCFEIYELGECTDEMLAKYSEINHTYWQKLERGELTKPEVLVGRFAEFFEKQGLDVSAAPAFNKDYQVRLGDTVCFEDNALEVILGLKGKVLQCAVTNGTKVAQTRKLENSGLDTLLDDVFISDEIGIEKPMIGFFEEVWKKIGYYAKDEVLIVGDSLTSDIKGGVLSGIPTCWYRPENFDLEALGQKDVYETYRPDYEISHLNQIYDILEISCSNSCDE